MPSLVEFAGNRGEGRFYNVTVGDQVATVPSVTSVLSVWPKPWAFAWASKEERLLMLETSHSYAMGVLRSRYADSLAEVVKDSDGDGVVSAKLAAKLIDPEYLLPTAAQWRAGLEAHTGSAKANRRKSKEATDRGKLAHSKIEHKIAQMMGATELPPWPVSEDAREDEAAEVIFMHWEDWAKAVALTPLAIERRVGSIAYGTAGTIDCIGEFTHEGERVRATMDWKGSKAIYPDQRIQGAVYRRLWNMTQHEDEYVSHVVIARFPRSLDEPDFNPAKDIVVMEPGQADRWEALFPHMLAIFNAHEEYEQASKAAERAKKAADKAAKKAAPAGAK